MNPLVGSQIKIFMTPLSTVSNDLEDQIRGHNQNVLRPGPDRVCYRKFCAACDADGPFAPHDLRPRELRTVANNMVVRFDVYLARWNCRRCGNRFTDFPDFRSSL